MADLFIPVGGDPKFRLQYVDVSGGTADKFAPGFTPVDASGRKQVFSAGGAGTFAIDQTTPGTTNFVETRQQNRRTAGILHRSAINVVDKLATPAAPTVTDVTSGGSLAQGTAYNAAVAASSVVGTTAGGAVGTVTTAASGGSVHAVQLTVAQITGATSYDLFMSTDAAPKWVARITESQRALGCTVTGVGTVTATTAGAGLVNVNVVGTGLTSTTAPFNLNTAYVFAGITPIDCTGYQTAIVEYTITVTDLRSAPTVALIWFLKDPASATYRQLNSVTASFPGTRVPLSNIINFSVWGAPGLIVLVDTLVGQGTTVDIYASLV